MKKVFPEDVALETDFLAAVNADNRSWVGFEAIAAARVKSQTAELSDRISAVDERVARFYDCADRAFREKIFSKRASEAEAQDDGTRLLRAQHLEKLSALVTLRQKSELPALLANLAHEHQVYPCFRVATLGSGEKRKIELKPAARLAASRFSEEGLFATWQDGVRDVVAWAGAASFGTSSLDVDKISDELIAVVGRLQGELDAGSTTGTGEEQREEITTTLERWVSGSSAQLLSRPASEATSFGKSSSAQVAAGRPGLFSCCGGGGGSATSGPTNSAAANSRPASNSKSKGATSAQEQFAFREFFTKCFPELARQDEAAFGRTALVVRRADEVLRVLECVESSSVTCEQLQLYLRYAVCREYMEDLQKSAPEITRKYFLSTVDAVYAETYCPLAIRERILEDVGEALEGLADEIASTSWLSGETKRAMMERIHDVSVDVGQKPAESWSSAVAIPAQQQEAQSDPHSILPPASAHAAEVARLGALEAMDPRDHFANVVYVRGRIRQRKAFVDVANGDVRVTFDPATNVLRVPPGVLQLLWHLDAGLELIPRTIASTVRFSVDDHFPPAGQEVDAEASAKRQPGRGEQTPSPPEQAASPTSRAKGKLRRSVTASSAFGGMSAAPGRETSAGLFQAGDRSLMSGAVVPTAEDRRDKAKQDQVTVYRGSYANADAQTSTGMETVLHRHGGILLALAVRQVLLGVFQGDRERRNRRKHEPACNWWSYESDVMLTKLKVRIFEQSASGSVVSAAGSADPGSGSGGDGAGGGGDAGGQGGKQENLRPFAVLADAASLEVPLRRKTMQGKEYHAQLLRDWCHLHCDEPVRLTRALNNCDLAKETLGLGTTDTEKQIRLWS
eukprot:g11037.t1